MKTIKEKIYEKIEMFLEGEDIGLMVFPRELVADLSQILDTLFKQELNKTEDETNKKP